MNKKLISIWMLAFCTSVGASVQVAAMESLEEQVEETDQNEAKKVLKKTHVCIKFSVKGEDNTDYKDPKDMGEDIKALKENGMFIIESSIESEDYPSMIFSSSDVTAARKSSGITKVFKRDLTQNDFFKIINNLLKKTPYKCNAEDDIRQAKKPYQKFSATSNFKVIVKQKKLSEGKPAEPTCFIILEKKKNSLMKGLKIAAGIGIPLVIIISISYLVWKWSKKEEKQGNKKQQGSKKKRRGNS